MYDILYYTIYDILYTIYYILYTIYYILYIIYYILHIIYYILYKIYYLRELALLLTSSWTRARVKAGLFAPSATSLPRTNRMNSRSDVY